MRSRITFAAGLCLFSLSFAAIGADGVGAKPVVKAHAAPKGLIAMHPGFSQKEDGATRVYVDLSATAQVEEKRGAKQLTYVIKNARVPVRNNTRALETAHFNTPVLRAKLIQKGRDVWLVVDLRAEATATWKVDAAGEGARLAIDFPSGNYLPSEEPSSDAGAPKGADE